MPTLGEYKKLWTKVPPDEIDDVARNLNIPAHVPAGIPDNVEMGGNARDDYQKLTEYVNSPAC